MAEKFLRVQRITFRSLEERLPNVDPLLFRIHAFEQLDQPWDYNIPSKQWKRIRTFVDRLVPKFRKEAKAQLLKIDDYKQAAPINEIVYNEIFKFIPSDAVITILVLKAAYSD